MCHPRLGQTHFNIVEISSSFISHCTSPWPMYFHASEPWLDGSPSPSPPLAAIILSLQDFTQCQLLCKICTDSHVNCFFSSVSMPFACTSLKPWISFVIRISDSCSNSEQIFVLTTGTYYAHPHWTQYSGVELTGYFSCFLPHSKMVYFSKFLFYALHQSSNYSEGHGLEWA